MDLLKAMILYMTILRKRKNIFIENKALPIPMNMEELADFALAPICCV